MNAEATVPASLEGVAAAGSGTWKYKPTRRGGSFNTRQSLGGGAALGGGGSPGPSPLTLGGVNSSSAGAGAAPSPPLSSRDLGFYREIDTCQKILSACKDIVLLLAQIKEVFLRDGGMKLLNSHRSELHRLCKGLSEKVGTLQSVTGVLTSYAQGSFGSTYSSKISKSAAAIISTTREEVMKYAREVAFSPSDPEAQRKFYSSVLFVVDHVQTIKSTVRPYLAQQKSSSGAFVPWAEVGDEKSSAVFDNMFSLSKDIARSIDDLIAIDCQYRKVQQLSQIQASSTDRTERILKLVDYARKRATIVPDYDQQLKLFEAASQFRLQANRFLMAERTFLRKLRNQVEKWEKEDRLEEGAREGERKESERKAVAEENQKAKELPRVPVAKGPKRPAPAPPTRRGEDPKKTTTPTSPPVARSQQGNPTSPRPAGPLPSVPQPSKAAPPAKKVCVPNEKLKRAKAKLQNESEEFSTALLALLQMFGDGMDSDGSYRATGRGSKCILNDGSKNEPKDTIRKHPTNDKAKQKPTEETDENEDESLTNDVNIWDELQEADDEGTVMYGLKKKRGAGGNSAEPQITIKAATLNRLVVRLTDESSHDLDFVKTFITTFQSFTTPEMLFEKLLQRYTVPLYTKGDRTEEEWKRTVVTPIHIRVINVLNIWIKNRFPDFNYALLKKINSFIDNNLMMDGHENWAKSLVRLIRRKIEARGTEVTTIDTRQSSLAKIMRGASTDFVLNYKERTIAEHLCVIEFDIYKSIQPVELMNQAWNKDKYKHRAPNVLKLIKRFNMVNSWVMTCILTEPKLKKRGQLLARFIKIALHLYELNNFNTTLSVISAFSNAALHRLKFTRAEVPEKLWAKFSQMHSALSGKHYDNYRAILHSVNPPVLPYLGVYLSDLTFVEDGNPNFIGSLINFKKRELIYEVVSEIQQYQQKEYNFKTDPTILSLLTHLPFESDEEKMWELSMSREPRNVEKASELP